MVEYYYKPVNPTLNCEMLSSQQGPRCFSHYSHSRNVWQGMVSIDCINYNTTNIQMLEASGSCSCMLPSNASFSYDFLSLLLILSRLKHNCLFSGWHHRKTLSLESFPSLIFSPLFSFNLYCSLRGLLPRDLNVYDASVNIVS